MSVQRVYDPDECGVDGQPLDWDECRTCHGHGHLRGSGRELPAFPPTCPRCDGHGSLRAAALAAWAEAHDVAHTASGKVRCEDCGHPMSEGTWEGTGVTVEQALGVIDRALRSGIGIEGVSSLRPVHFSPCDDVCKHGGPGRYGANHVLTRDVREQLPPHVPREASWRPVDVRPLGWRHDLRPEKLAILCLRCWAARRSNDREDV